MIAVEYHRLEKSLAISSKRVGAGQDACARLVQALSHFKERFEPSQDYFFGVNVLREYTAVNQAYLDPELSSRITDVLQSAPGQATSDVENRTYGYDAITWNRDDLETPLTSIAFLKSRRSVRNFLPKQIDRRTVLSIVDVAIKTPSVCNRQSWKIISITSKDAIQRVLKFQNGNSGFSEDINNLFVILVDLSYFLSIDERNQPWIEGGLFSMSVLQSIHGHGLGGCALNWCASEGNDRLIRDCLSIGDNFIIVMLIAFGEPPGEFRCPSSPRRDVESFLSEYK